MKLMQEDFIKNLALEQILNSSYGEQLVKFQAAFEKIQSLYQQMASEDANETRKIQIGTILVFTVLRKMTDGKNPRDFSQDDWLEIIDAVSDYATFLEGERYSAFVFLLYADYIEASVESIKDGCQERMYNGIIELAIEIRNHTVMLGEGSIAEVTYIEDCLWLSLEAMFRLLTASMNSFVGDEFTQLAEGITMFAFESARLRLYHREQTLINDYLNNQQRLDAQLELQYQSYLDLLEQQNQQFQQLLEDAFNPDFCEELEASAIFARAAGVKDEEILDTVEDIDDFFLN